MGRIICGASGGLGISGAFPFLIFFNFVVVVVISKIHLTQMFRQWEHVSDHVAGTARVCCIIKSFYFSVEIVTYSER